MIRAMRYRTLVPSSTFVFPRSGHAPAPKSRRRWNTTGQKEEEMAVKLHEELSQVMEKKKALSNKKSGGFVHFVKKNQSQMINIAASFFCVVLAYQIIALRKSGRARQSELEEKRKELQERQELLRSLTDSSFAQRVASECADQITQEKESSRSWSFGMRPKDKESLEATIQSVIDQYLSEQIGDAGLTEEQKRERAVMELRSAESAQAGDEAAEIIAIVEDASGSKVAQKRVFSI